ncbi:hypothetical protein BJX65DRAFT_277959 [Aspergillus insuetus]
MYHKTPRDTTGRFMANYSRQVSSRKAPSAQTKGLYVELDRSTRILSPSMEMISEDPLHRTYSVGFQWPRKADRYPNGQPARAWRAEVADQCDGDSLPFSLPLECSYRIDTRGDDFLSWWAGAHVTRLSSQFSPNRSRIDRYYTDKINLRHIASPRVGGTIVPKYGT